MGYTHYWDLDPTKTKENQAGLDKALPAIRDIVQRHRSIVCKEKDEPTKKPTTTRKLIKFNGREDEGAETFFFTLDEDGGFCKTYAREYDIAVCEILLVLAAHIPSMEIRSDGFYGCTHDERAGKFTLDVSWDDARENVRMYGVKVFTQAYERSRHNPEKYNIKLEARVQ